MAVRTPIPHPAEVIDENDIEAAILERLYNNEALRQSKATIRVQMMGSLALLTGNVRIDSHAQLAEAMVRRVPGVRQVRNEIVTDARIANEAALRLALDPNVRLTTDHITISSLLGSVMLTGKVDSEARKEAALSALESVRGVWEIVDGLEVSARVGQRPGAAVQAATPGVVEGPAVVGGAHSEAAHGGPAAGFQPEWPRKTKKGKAATPLSAAARTRING